MKKEKFEKLSKSEKRVLIAKDVIKALNMRKLVAQHGTYMRVDDPKLKRTVLGNKQLSDVFDKATKKKDSCHVCALGACFVAGVQRFNNVVATDIGYSAKTEIDDLNNDDTMRDFLVDYFSMEQLHLIENCFESSDAMELAPSGEDWKPKLEGTERMIAIMKNIVKNKGTFKPKGLKDK